MNMNQTCSLNTIEQKNENRCQINDRFRVMVENTKVFNVFSPIYNEWHKERIHVSHNKKKKPSVNIMNITREKGL